MIQNQSTDRKQRAIRAICLLFTVLWMLLIFYMSSKTADVSSDMSSGICYRLCSLFVKDFEVLGEAEKIAMVESMQFWVRKTAHCFEYTVLGFLLSSTLQSFGASHRFLFSALIGICYSISDEVHQLFVPGRSGELRDVAIDSAGIILGCCVFVVFIKIISSRRKS